MSYTVPKEEMVAISRIVFKLGHGTECRRKITEFMAINRISIGEMTIIFSFYFNFNINNEVNIWLMINTPLYRIVCWPIGHCAPLLVSNSIKWNIYKLSIYPKINYTVLGSTNMANFFHYQILASISILKVKSVIFVWHFGPYFKLNTTCDSLITRYVHFNVLWLFTKATWY